MSAGAAFEDRELVELLADRPDLLAIADAISAVCVPPRHQRVGLRVPLLAAAVLAAAAVALLSPWSQSRGGVLSKALAAVSTDKVLHTVVVQRVPGQQIVNLASGRSTPETIRIESWFDFKHSLKRTVISRGGTTTDVLATPHGVFSSSGVVPTCAWIAAHPVQATKLRVSCNSTGQNGTTPRHIHEAIPTPDPALARFITGYRRALTTGHATKLGRGTISGQRVFWIGFTLDAHQTERVAVDAKTYRPLEHETVVQGKVAAKARVVVAEKIAFAPPMFARPKLTTEQLPVVGNVVRTEHVSRATAEQSLGGHAKSLGSQFASLPLTHARLDSLRTGYGPFSHKPITNSSGVEFFYGNGTQRAGTGPYLHLSEARTAQMAYFGQTGRGPLPGTLELTTFGATPVAKGATQGRSFWLGQMHTGGLYITIEGSARAAVIAAAKALAGIR